MSAVTYLLACVPAATAAIGWATSARRAVCLRRHALTDRLTGLANREALAAQLRVVAGTAPAVGVLMLDLDAFKRVNDRYGHDEGNRVLRHVADQLRSVALPRELPARLHGDEFALLLGALPSGSAGRRTAAARVSAIRRAIAEPLVTDTACHSVTASVGAAVLPARGADLGALLALADASMYRAKPGRDSRRATTFA
ncbi:MAG: GGDEF domain-containing protein [Haloechinothrix sp.]